MSNVEDFRSKLASDSEFASSIKNCTTPEEIVKTAKKAGIDLSHADLARSMASESHELTDEDLENVSSGTIMAAALVK